jgi:hypothetical protein
MMLVMVRDAGGHRDHSGYLKLGVGYGNVLKMRSTSLPPQTPLDDRKHVFTSRGVCARACTHLCAMLVLWSQLTSISHITFVLGGAVEYPLSIYVMGIYARARLVTHFRL